MKNKKKEFRKKSTVFSEVKRETVQLRNGRSRERKREWLGKNVEENKKRIEG